MARYSNTVETNGRTIRYNYDTNRVEWFEPATEEDLTEDAAFRAEFPNMKHGLYIFDDDNNIIIKSYACDKEEWEDMSIRDELLRELNRKIEELLSFVNYLDTCQVSN